MARTIGLTFPPETEAEETAGENKTTPETEAEEPRKSDKKAGKQPAFLVNEGKVIAYVR